MFIVDVLYYLLMLRGRNSAMLKDRGWHGGTAPTPNLNYSG